MAAHRIRLGVVGAGIAARELHWPALKVLSDLYEIVAVCNHNIGKAQSFAQLIGGTPIITTEYRELLQLPEVEAVDLTLPIILNAVAASDALHAGIHVIVEKPIAATAEAGRAVVAEARAHPGLVFLVAENVRYERRFRIARGLIDDGKIGRVVMIHGDILQPVDPSNPYAQTGWRQIPEHLGGFLSDGGVHQTAAMQLLGGAVESVQGMTASFDRDSDIPDTLMMNLRFSSGAIGHLTYSVGIFKEEPAPFRVFGTAGTLTVQDDRIRVITEEGSEDVPVESEPNGFELEFRDFYRAIVEGKRLDVQPHDALDDLLVVDAGFRSFREGKTVSL
jgi:predicted dehydrogenase